MRIILFITLLSFGVYFSPSNLIASAQAQTTTAPSKGWVRMPSKQAAAFWEKQRERKAEEERRKRYAMQGKAVPPKKEMTAATKEVAYSSAKAQAVSELLSIAKDMQDGDTLPPNTEVEDENESDTTNRYEPPRVQPVQLAPRTQIEPANVHSHQNSVNQGGIGNVGGIGRIGPP